MSGQPGENYGKNNQRKIDQSDYEGADCTTAKRSRAEK